MGLYASGSSESEGKITNTVPIMHDICGCVRKCLACFV